MAASKKAQEDKNLKVLRELAALPANRQCMDCHQRGPTYVNTAIWSFVCTTCSGRLRGLSPPHRVKSISMTTFSQAEIDQLRKGGNEVAKAKWLGLWNDRLDKMPDAKDDHGVMEFMREKYEKKRWFTSDPAPKQEEITRKPSIGKPPQKEKKTPTSGGAMSLRHRPQVSPSPEGGGDVKQQPRQQSLVDTSQTAVDPFSPAPPAQPVKPPVGGVAVLPGVAAVLKPDKTRKSPSSDFGAFTSATSTDGLLTLAGAQNANTSSGNLSLSPAHSTGQLSSSLTGSGGDKYGALADLDSQIKELKVVDTPPSQPPPSVPAANPFGSAVPAQNGTQGGGGNMWAGQGGVAPSGSGFNMPNPFGGAPNPFQPGAGPMMQGGAQYGAPQQPFTAVGMQPQLGAAVGGAQGFQGNAAPQGYMGVGAPQVGQFGQQGQWSASGGFPQPGAMTQPQQQSFGQMGATQLGYPQQQMQGFGAPQGQFGASRVPQGQFGASGVPQGQFGASGVPQGQFGASGVPQGQFGASGVPQGQFGASGMPQGQFGASGVPQGQFGASGMSQGQFGASGVPQGQFGASGMSQGQFGASGVPQGQFGGGSPQGQFGGSGAPQGQFGGSGAPQGQFGGGNFQWGKMQQPSSVATSSAPKASPSQASTSTTGGAASMGWSTEMTKPVPSSATSKSPATSLTVGGWSDNILIGNQIDGGAGLSGVGRSTQGSSGMSGWAGQSGTPTSGWAGQSGTPTSGWAGQSGTPTSGRAGQSGTPTSGWTGQSGTPTSGWVGQSGTPTSGWGAGMPGSSPASGWGSTGGGSVAQPMQPAPQPSMAQQPNWAAGVGGNAVGGGQSAFGANMQGFTSWTGSSAPNTAAENPFGQTAQAKSTNPFL